MATERKATREDVARLAGVSKTTVTYVINNTEGTRISPDTRQRVLDAARKLKYQADFSATCLVRGKTNILGLLVPLHEQFTDFYSKMIYGLQNAAADTDYHFLYLAQNQPEKYMKSIAQGYLEGTFVLQSKADDRPLAAVYDAGLPTVAINHLSSLPLPHVSMDYEGNIISAVQDMVAAGRKNIALVYGAWDNQPNHRYRDAFTGLMSEYAGRAVLSRIPVDKNVLLNGLEKKLTPEDYDGIIVDGYEFGMQLESYLHRRAAKIGKELDVTVFSDSYISRDFDPRIRVKKAQPDLIGRTAWECMAGLLEGGEMKAEKKLIAFE